MNIQRIEQTGNEMVIYYVRFDGKDTCMKMLMPDSKKKTIISTINLVIEELDGGN